MITIPWPFSFIGGNYRHMAALPGGSCTEDQRRVTGVLRPTSGQGQVTGWPDAGEAVRWAGQACITVPLCDLIKLRSTAAALALCGLIGWLCLFMLGLIFISGSYADNPVLKNLVYSKLYMMYGHFIYSFVYVVIVFGKTSRLFFPLFFYRIFHIFQCAACEICF